MSSSTNTNHATYGAYVMFIAGLGGLLYGIDVGIIATALLYLGATVSLSTAQTSVIVSAVFIGGTISSLVAGLLSDWLGRKRVMLLSGLLFILSVAMIVAAQGFALLFAGRFLQGISAGAIAVVVPLYLAESLSSTTRGRGTAIFQFMLTLGLVAAALLGYHYTSAAKAAIEAAAGNTALIQAAQNHAWRSMFLAAVYPGILFFAGSIFLSESPRWLFRKGRTDDALAALRRTSTEQEAQTQLREMEELAAQKEPTTDRTKTSDSLLQRKYVVPFLLACVILTCNQTTGINSILSFLVLILREAGMSTTHATQGNIVVTVLNCLMTLVAVALIERKGRKFLLTLGTAGVVVSLACAGILLYRAEAKRVNVQPQVQAAVQGSTLHLPLAALQATSGQLETLTVSYTDGSGSKLISARSDDPTPTLDITGDKGPLIIQRATLGPVPSQATGWAVTAFLAFFIASFAVGPGVVVWLALSELMPTRIRSAGMGIALLLNQGASALIAGMFLPVAGRFGYYAMFALWAAASVVYFLVAAFALPETKGKTLEEIERHFEGSKSAA